MKKELLILLFTLCYVVAFTQNSGTPKTSTPSLHPFLKETSKSPVLKEKALTFIAHPKQADVKFNPILVSDVSRNYSHDKSGVERVKAEQQIIRDDPNNKKIGNDEESRSGISFEKGTSFYADLDNGCPNDNTIAISKAGRIMSMMNGHVGIYSSNGVKINVYSLEAFFNFNISDPCDPKVEYDPVNDRFFMFVQACGSSKDKVAMAFSTTNDPNGSWNIYVFDSDALGDGSWSDYPKVAITRDEVFVSLNLFSQGSSSSFRQSIVYQMDKYDGYQGNSLSYKIWDNFPSTTLIIRSGVGQYGPGAYLINTYAGDADEIFLTDITGNLDNSNSQKKTFEIPVEYYTAPPSAYQPNSDYRLDTGDCRAQDGYYQNGTIHFVHTVSNQSYASIRYHRMSPSELNADKFFLTTAVGEKDYTYPSISPFTNDLGDQTSIVHFAASGLDTPPEMRAKVFNHDFSTEGSGYVFGGSGGVEEACYNSSNNYSRWGDYSGIAFDYAASTPTVWLAGSVASSSVNEWWTYIAELTATGTPTSTEEVTALDMKMFPNPAVDYIQVEISMNKKVPSTFSLYTLDGQLISHLYDGVLKAGNNTFTFDTSTLLPNTYLLTITNQKNEIIKTERIIVTK
ncbi:MAG: T9SS type A sorting domain-containing protein [Saprospiraceae bacterium]|nr:T9SS type A sorting domain-containing protein [Saprospiraceae bacterium]